MEKTPFSPSPSPVRLLPLLSLFSPRRRMTRHDCSLSLTRFQSMVHAFLVLPFCELRFTCPSLVRTVSLSLVPFSLNLRKRLFPLQSPHPSIPSRLASSLRLIPLPQLSPPLLVSEMILVFLCVCTSRLFSPLSVVMGLFRIFFLSCQNFSFLFPLNSPPRTPPFVS